jgi:4-hydroxy-tetrahydrodipicolinate synthase
MVTPLSGRNELDVAALERIVEHILSGGVHGLFVLGTTGEAPSLSDRLKEQVVERTVRLVNGRVSVLVGVSDTSLASSESLTRFAAECGADAVVLAPPSYFPLHQDDLLRYYAEFASEAPLPVVLYNIPSHARHVIALETVRQLLDVPNIVGLKDSAGDMLTYQRFVALVAQRPGFALLMGPEELLAESVLMGGHGGVCGGANLVPRLYVDLYEAAVTGDLRRVHQLQHQVLRISETLYRVGDPPSGYLTGLKCALSHMGLCSDRLAEPYHALRADKRAQIARHLQDLGLVSPHVGAGVGSGAGTVVAGSPRHNPTHKHTAEDGR